MVRALREKVVLAQYSSSFHLNFMRLSKKPTTFFPFPRPKLHVLLKVCELRGLMDRGRRGPKCPTVDQKLSSMRESEFAPLASACSHPRRAWFRPRPRQPCPLSSLAAPSTHHNNAFLISLPFVNTGASSILPRVAFQSKPPRPTPPLHQPWTTQAQEDGGLQAIRSSSGSRLFSSSFSCFRW